MLGYFLRIALQQIARFRAQSALVILGVGIGTANIILLMSMTDMGRQQTVNLLEEFGARVLIITPFVDFSLGPLAVFSQANAIGHIPTAAYESLKRCPSIAPRVDGSGRQVSAMLPLGATVTAGERSRYTVVAGATELVADFGGFEVQEGRWLQDADEAAQAAVTVLGYKLAADLFGDKSPLGQTVRIKDTQFEVIGVIRQQLTAGRGIEEHDSRAFLPLTTAQQLFAFSGVQGMLARYAEGQSAEEAIASTKQCIAAALPAGQHVDDVVSVFTIKEATSLMDGTLGIFRTVLLGVASIALIVAGIGILNVMLIRVLRRRNEIGLRRAVGATTGSIVSQFLLESALQALLGSLLGLLIAAGGLLAFADFAGWEFYISVRTLLLAFGFGGLVGLLFGSYPAYTAARVDPIASLRYEL